MLSLPNNLFLLFNLKFIYCFCKNTLLCVILPLYFESFFLQLCLYLQDHPGLLDNYTGIVKVFEHLCEKSMKARDTNDIFALKTHYYSVLFKTAGKMQSEKGSIDGLIKS